jgi:MFS family permease
MTSDSTASASLLRNGDFVRLWFGQTISVLGSQVTLLAVPIAAALILKVTPLEFALLTTFEFLPHVVLGLPAGVWVDRLRRRPILISADVGRAAVLLSIPLAYAAGRLTIWQLYIVAIITGALTVFFDVAYQSYLPSIVNRDELVDANGKLELTRQASQRIGPGIAGVLVGVITAPFAIVADAISFVVSAVLVRSIRHREAAPHGPIRAVDGMPERRPSFRSEIAVGLRYVSGHRWLRAVALSVALGYLFGTIADSILILHLASERGVSPAAIGLAFTLGSIGVISGALVTAPLTRRMGVGAVIVIAAAGESVAWIPVAAAPDPLLVPALVLTIASLSFFGVAWNVNAVSLRQAITPPAFRGKVNATMRFVAWSTIPVGSVLGGALGGVIGLHATIWVGALGCITVVVPVALSSLRHVREMPAEADDVPPAAAFVSG